MEGCDCKQSEHTMCLCGDKEALKSSTSVCVFRNLQRQSPERLFIFFQLPTVDNPADICLIMQEEGRGVKILKDLQVVPDNRGVLWSSWKYMTPE